SLFSFVGRCRPGGSMKVRVTMVVRETVPTASPFRTGCSLSQSDHNQAGLEQRGTPVRGRQTTPLGVIGAEPRRRAPGMDRNPALVCWETPAALFGKRLHTEVQGDSRRVNRRQKPGRRKE